MVFKLNKPVEITAIVFGLFAHLPSRASIRRLSRLCVPTGRHPHSGVAQAGLLVSQLHESSTVVAQQNDGRDRFAGTFEARRDRTPTLSGRKFP